MLLDMPTHAFGEATSRTPKNSYFIDTIELSVKYSKESIKHSVYSKLGIKWLKWGDINSMRRGPQWEANWIPILNK